MFEGGRRGGMKPPHAAPQQRGWILVLSQRMDFSPLSAVEVRCAPSPLQGFLCSPGWISRRSSASQNKVPSIWPRSRDIPSPCAAASYLPACSLGPGWAGVLCGCQLTEKCANDHIWEGIYLARALQLEYRLSVLTCLCSPLALFLRLAPPETDSSRS